MSPPHSSSLTSLCLVLVLQLRPENCRWHPLTGFRHMFSGSPLRQQRHDHLPLPVRRLQLCAGEPSDSPWSILKGRYLSLCWLSSFFVSCHFRVLLFSSSASSSIRKQGMLWNTAAAASARITWSSPKPLWVPIHKHWGNTPLSTTLFGCRAQLYVEFQLKKSKLLNGCVSYVCIFYLTWQRTLNHFFYLNSYFDRFILTRYFFIVLSLIRKASAKWSSCYSNVILLLGL